VVFLDNKMISTQQQMQLMKVPRWSLGAKDEIFKDYSWFPHHRTRSLSTSQSLFSITTTVLTRKRIALFNHLHQQNFSHQSLLLSYFLPFYLIGDNLMNSDFSSVSFLVLSVRVFSLEALILSRPLEVHFHKE
jgi:hypothetical protein